RIPYPVTIAFGNPLKAEDADVATMREELLKLGELCFSRRRSLDRHLAEECVRGLKRRRFATAVIEGTDHTRLSRAKLLGAAAALSRHLRKVFFDERIAIVLPASKGSMVDNVGADSSRFAFAAFANSQARRSRRGNIALYKRHHRRTKRRCR